ncbi:ABC transporter permease [Streptomyces sulfonofaciens]|uniref:ABC transporter permease n=1 Tax=Streptomyces sulfonofaciens TaxID=68272 RepID=A0A919GA63_9ACTN|nr:ABC transporter permease subunit [Streptomyces sulfonofaciens]GHH80266.1 ABC transporter permease [Streptomyces sulfonofaciens]
MSNALTWLTDPVNWQDQLGTPGIPTQLGNHLAYSLAAVAIATVIAFPLGLLIGHTGRGTPVVTFANGLRALPTLGLLILLYVVVSPHISGRGDAPYLVPTEIVLVLLAIPPVLGNTCAGVQNVDPAVRDASVGMGMTGREVLFRVELPIALPLVLSGLRSAVLQVVATATVAAYVGLGGIGRYLYDGLAARDFAQMTGGAVLVAALALVLDGVLAGVQRYAVSPGVSGRFGTGPAQAGARVAEAAGKASVPA